MSPRRKVQRAVAITPQTHGSLGSASLAAAEEEEAHATVAFLGTRIRGLRAQRNLTLQQLAGKTGLSSSMLSLVERGKTSPSIGTLVAICSALGVHMTDLFDTDSRLTREPVVRVADQPVIETPEGVIRRIIRTDDARGIEIVFNEYEPGTGSGASPVHHAGYEYGVVLEGKLTVEVDGHEYELRRGDSIGYDSKLPHKIENAGKRHVRAVWVNLER
ncbi:MAG: cupin domain-containing protein [Actinomycetota bacterium]